MNLQDRLLIHSLKRILEDFDEATEQAYQMLPEVTHRKRVWISTAHILAAKGRPPTEDTPQESWGWREVVVPHPGLVPFEVFHDKIYELIDAVQGEKDED